MSDARPLEGTPDGARLTIESERTDSGITVAIAGDLDFATAPQLAEALEHLGNRETDRVVVNCARVSFLDSSGLNVLVKAWSEAKAGDQDRFAVVDPAPQIRRVFEICGVTAMVDQWDA